MSGESNRASWGAEPSGYQGETGARNPKLQGRVIAQMTSSFTDPNILASEAGTFRVISSFGSSHALYARFSRWSRFWRQQQDVCAGTRKDMRPVNSDVSGLAGRYFRVGSGITRDDVVKT